jgi:uncharacterized membrane protein YedE/YeeE
MADLALPPAAARLPRLAPWLVVPAGWLALTWIAGIRQGLLLLIGLGFGAVLAATAFGFTTGWRIWLRQRDPTGLIAQFVAIGLAMLATVPLLAAHPELTGAVAPLSWSLVIGAFVFGAAMQVADGCGSGTLYKAGLGHPASIAAFPGLVVGSFLGAAHLDWWLSWGSLPGVSLIDVLGARGAIAAQALALGTLGVLAWRLRRQTGTRWGGRAVWIGAVLLALLGVANLIVAGQPWGIVYGPGLWGAKIATGLGADLSGNAFWGREAQQAQIAAPVLEDVTSVTDLGLLAGALLVAARRGTACPAIGAVTARQWSAAIIAGLVLGYSSRLAFGCNVGAYFSGISSASAHGWVWFAAAFCGSILGVRLRERLGMKG